MTKRCNICKQVKPLSEFYKDRSTPNGYAYRCKQCDKRKVIRWAKASGYDRKDTRRNKNNPSRQAKNAVKDAVKRGELLHISSQRCVDCGQRAAHYHHESYAMDRWLDVVPLCISCHRRRHAKKDYSHEIAHA